MRDVEDRSSTASVRLTEARPLPRHIAIIMDGNGRWAQRRGLSRTAGHRAGVEALREVVKGCAELGIEYLTLYAFSTENWRRPRSEVMALWDLLVESLDRRLDELDERGVRILVIGEAGRLPPRVRAAVARAVSRTADNTGLTLILALNYGGRREIVAAVRAIAREVRAGRLDPSDIDEATVERHLYTAGIPDPDLLIRPSGELRVSNFLLWQLAYTEFWVTPVLWPDFGRRELEEAIRAYQGRERRFGGLGG
ncbi:MAG: isoprenyl transferase [Clostridia bacterium]|nr:isoprenyl transferase [Clostridia bacterium]